MGLRFFSDKNRPVHLGPFPLERARRGPMPDPARIPRHPGLSFRRPDDPASIVNAMADYQAMMDAIRDGFVNKARSTCPNDATERANHLKAFGYFSDATMVGIGPLLPEAHLSEPRQNPDIARLAEDLRIRQTKTLAAGIDLIMADLKESMEAPRTTIASHDTALVFLYEIPRDPNPGEIGTDWITDAQHHRACLRATETAVVIANYIRLLGWNAKAHSATSTDVDLNICTVAAGLAYGTDDRLVNPWLHDRFGVAVVTTDLELAHDAPLSPDQPKSLTKGLSWTLGTRSSRSRLNDNPFDTRRYVDGPHPFETLKRIDTPTTYIDEPNVPRVPKRTDMFARAQFGDMGKKLQDKAKGGYYVRKAAPSSAQRRMLGAFVLLQDGPPENGQRPANLQNNADAIKATAYWLGCDAVGISRCPDWVWYSHDARGDPIDPPHDQAISIIIDQGYETMEGASGDDWISVAQSMRAYLRFSLLGGVLARQIRNLGYSAKAHSVMDGDVLQPPLLLLSGLGEVSRIGEVILNPFLGPRLKSGVITTDMPLAHDRPIDFGLQRFCESCNKCARECPSGAITAGPKRMFNGYEIWKSDSQKCAAYRITTEGGAMCGRCMKTCPWNLEGLFAEKPFRWAAMNVPQAAPLLAKLDDAAGRGGLNPVKKWWWDLELQENGSYAPTTQPVKARDLQKDLDLKYEDQTLAVYPAPLAPHPYPYPDPMDREAGIAAYAAMVSAEEHKARLAKGDTSHLHRPKDATESPVVPVMVSKVEKMSPSVTKYEFRSVDGSDLPAWTAGAHLDLVVAPEYLRQYSMSGDPADRSVYQIGVLREDHGRGGSALLHRIFTEGRRVFVSRPINHFPLVEDARFTWLMGGGIGVTPMIAMAHRLHALGRPFALHYSVKTRAEAGYLDDLAAAPWADKVHVHISDEGTRADLDAIMPDYSDGQHIYTCGPVAYMNSVMEAAERKGFPEPARHLEYFAVPDLPDYENHAFTLRLKDGRAFHVPPDKSATDVLAENGVSVDVKCADGICGVCKARVLGGAVEHRDFVLSKAQRVDQVILCQSRAAEPDGEITIEL
ncbi:reductive dehalogenase domain-containing protein [uncultured Marivita sp.]|uniref:2Fe-2S iron-sulfur cluster-binding protein n=1 Tax=uncultured Marivita sp. TaxID=888080 RepID=UPI002607A301|nr:reductive dehalogenase domain-containing protein [uncultured Marivita sp.]